MSNKEEKLLDVARKLYKPTEEVVKLVLSIYKLFDEPSKCGINGFRFDNIKLELDGLAVESVLRASDHCFIEVHWVRNRRLSCHDNFCSAFILSVEELKKIESVIKENLHQQVENDIQELVNLKQIITSPKQNENTEEAMTSHDEF